MLLLITKCHCNFWNISSFYFLERNYKKILKKIKNGPLPPSPIHSKSLLWTFRTYFRFFPLFEPKSVRTNVDYNFVLSISNLYRSNKSRGAKKTGIPTVVHQTMTFGFTFKMNGWSIANIRKWVSHAILDFKETYLLTFYVTRHNKLWNLN